MAKTKDPDPSPTALAVLALLHEAPMHPYRMWHLIKSRAKDDVINVRQRTSLYQTIDRLTRSGLITVQETERARRRPERTIYDLTDEGRRVAVAWLRTMLSTVPNLFPPFPAALAHLPLLPADQVREELEHRAERLRGNLARIDGLLAEHSATIPRLFLIESEYQLEMCRAELNWVTSVVEDLRTGRLSWSDEWLREIVSRFESE